MLKQEVLKQVQDDEGKNIPQLFRLIPFCHQLDQSFSPATEIL
ncbi:hypothetical protein [Desertivirga xinjiangensis]|nr:hypothetical protein [Pedobacter xinjiangensis]